MGGSLCFDIDVSAELPAAEMFNAGVLRMHELAPIMAPDFIKSASIVQGDGGVGSVKQYDSTDALPYTTLKERIDLLDSEGLEVKYTVIEGADVGTKLASIAYHFKLSPAPGGGTGGAVCKMHADYHPLPGVDYSEEEMNADKAQVIGMFKAVEAYLLASRSS